MLQPKVINLKKCWRKTRCNLTARQVKQIFRDESSDRISASNQADWENQSREWRYFWNSASWEIHLTNAEDSKRAENNRDDDDSNINNEKDLYFSFIESFRSHRISSCEIEKNTFFSLKKRIDQALSDDEFLDIDQFFRSDSSWTVMSVFVSQLTSDQSQLQDNVAWSSIIQSSTSMTVNSNLSLNVESMKTMTTLKIWDSFKHKADIAGSNESSEVEIQNNVMYASSSTYLMTTEQLFEVLDDIEINCVINMSIINSIFEFSDECFKSLSKSTVIFSTLNEHNFKRKTQTERSDQCLCLNRCEHV